MGWLQGLADGPGQVLADRIQVYGVFDAGASVFRGVAFCPDPAARAGTDEPDRVDDVENRQGQIEDHGEQRHEASYNGGAGLLSEMIVEEK